MMVTISPPAWTFVIALWMCRHGLRGLSHGLLSLPPIAETNVRVTWACTMVAGAKKLARRIEAVRLHLTLVIV
ncbi:MAG: hypothetical protein ACRD3M_07540 [Thermoanaerobaculia bacterium]